MSKSMPMPAAGATKNANGWGNGRKEPRTEEPKRSWYSFWFFGSWILKFLPPMSEFRQDPMSRRWVIIGGERNGRPNEFVEAATRASGIFCPFCAGHETETPPAIASYSSNGKEHWLARVVPNKYPALSASGNGNGAASPSSLPGFGSHEVIIESPRHVASLSELTDPEAKAVFNAYRDRLTQLKSQRLYRYVQIFK